VSHQILLYYYYGHLDDAEAFATTEKAFLQELGLTGRIIIGDEGMNGTLEGETEKTEAYVAHLLEDPRFATMHIKRSPGNGHAFPRLSVKYRKEIVSSYLGEDDFNPADFTAPYVTAEELHAILTSGEEVHIVDMRNSYEHEVGHFEGSVLPPFTHFRDLKQAVNTLEDLKHKPVITVCTGGVRCEKAAGYLLKRGFTNVRQLYGGIVTYMEQYPNQHFLGKLYVFDSRVVMGFNTDSTEHQVIGRCRHCGEPCERFVNDDASETREHFICCENCSASRPGYVAA
jgi:UPF0176 protein